MSISHIHIDNNRHEKQPIYNLRIRVLLIGYRTAYTLAYNLHTRVSLNFHLVHPVTINSTSGVADEAYFQGLLLVARRGSGDRNSAVGTFYIPQGNTFLKTANCFSGVNVSPVRPQRRVHSRLVIVYKLFKWW